MTNGPFSFDALVALAGSRLRHDVACPLCGPAPGRTDTNRKRRVLRIWHPEPRFVTYYCARCGISGYAIDDGRAPVSRAVLEETRRKAEAFDRKEAAERLETARWLWSISRPIIGTIAEHYLRGPRGISGALPGTLRFLPPRNGHPPALIGAFGLPAEPEPGVLMISRAQVAGVHLTRLKPDGSGKRDEHEDESAKKMISRSKGWPLVLAPINDSGGLSITEGIEDGLSILVTGLGIWAAGCASRLPALAERVPDYVNCVTIFADPDTDGMRHARELERLLHARRLFATVAKLPEKSR